jgi:FixJ family two-component response regulator
MRLQISLSGAAARQSAGPRFEPWSGSQLIEPLASSCALRRVYFDPSPWCIRAVSANPHDHIVFIVDDDRRIRESLCELLSSFDLNAVAFGTAAEYIEHAKPDVPACLILDVELPDINGLDLQSQIAQENHPPIVFITGHGDIPASVRAIKAGAIDFLTKPFRQEDLLRAIHAAIAQDGEARRKRADLTELTQRLASLTPREREVLPLVVSGLLNKQAAAQLGISEITLQIHRSHIMKKMGAASLADLVRIAGTLEIPITHSRHAER